MLKKIILGPVEGMTENPLSDWNLLRILAFRELDYNNKYPKEEGMSLKILKWYKKEHDFFKKDEKIVKIEYRYTIAHMNQKKKMVFFSSMEGTMKEILVKSGDYVIFGDPIAVIDIFEQRYRTLPFNSDYTNSMILKSYIENL